MNLFDFFNKNSGALQAIFALVVAVATVVYAWLTYKLVNETTRMRRAQSEPRIEVFCRPSQISINLLEFVVKNIGLGPAYDIKFNIDTGRAAETMPKLVARLGAIQTLKTGMGFLAPGQEFFSFWDSVFGVPESALSARIVVKTTWKDSGGNQFEGVHVLNLEELLGMSRIGEPPMQTIADSLKNLSKAVNSVISNQRVKVDAFDADDRAQEAQELREYIDSVRQKNAENNPPATKS